MVNAKTYKMDNKKFNKLVKYFSSAEHDYNYSYEYDDEDRDSVSGSFYADDCFLIYGGRFFDTGIAFTLDASIGIDVCSGDYHTAPSSSERDEEVIVTVEYVEYQGERLKPTKNQTKVLEELIKNNVYIDRD